ncbi:3',5'-cyclic-nucleotide phosphodiesterase [Ideonella sp. 4Y16]|uniref:3',5'-cyclic-nucleotide phosphodiesterase n=1 Tax=Ideonella alba TaxID=2824118 RepID=A0A940YHI5_9BURK|nr:3',5'-cyclic-nucleotide phosphodiesterase [Ideonella alba]MBQ0932630.1 3',5'-cyclic-nucleotide phosphodiesterase [Ideonella alba]MBQ0943513.1 3',5'-cyclic-nucleotide phosphodiesterase [Ideonella alba]
MSNFLAQPAAPVVPAALPETRPATVRVLGCSGSIARDCRTTAFLLDDDVLIDAGTGVGDLSLDELLRVDHVLLSHSHLDHVLGVPLLADSVLRRRQGRGPIQVHALPQTLAVLRQHLFNDLLWPDFTRLPQPAQPVLSLHELAVGQTLELGAQRRRIRVLPARHTVPAVGYAVLGTGGDFVYTGDTGPNPALWEALRGLNLRQLVIEIAFSEGDRAIATDSLHHCPSTLAAELAQVPGEVEVLLTHVKPGEMPTVLAELAARLGPGRAVTALRAGQRLNLG